MTARSRTLIAVVAALFAVTVTSAIAAAKPAPRLVTFRSGIVIPNGHYLLTLNTNGHGTLIFGGKRHEVTLPSKILRELKRQLRDAHFSTLNGHYRHVTHVITGINGAAITYQGHTVTVAPGAKAPRALDQVVDSLRAIAQKFS